METDSTQPIGPCTCPEGTDHTPADCLYPNGCTGCTCESATCSGRSYCKPCREHTVHSEQHTHEPTDGRQAFRDGVRFGLFAYDMGDQMRRSSQTLHLLASLIER